MIRSVKKYNLGQEPESDLEFWLTQTPNQRLAALEKIRERHFQFFMNGNRPRFQRIYRIIK
jgi:hypothetical protein